jgi:hypothetical protein
MVWLYMVSDLCVCVRLCKLKKYVDSPYLQRNANECHPPLFHVDETVYVLSYSTHVYRIFIYLAKMLAG